MTPELKQEFECRFCGKTELIVIEELDGEYLYSGADGWLISRENHHHLCPECVGKMLESLRRREKRHIHDKRKKCGECEYCEPSENIIHLGCCSYDRVTEDYKAHGPMVHLMRPGCHEWIEAGKRVIEEKGAADGG